MTISCLRVCVILTDSLLVCRRWANFKLSGSPLGIGRRGHSAVAVNGERFVTG